MILLRADEEGKIAKDAQLMVPLVWQYEMWREEG